MISVVGLGGEPATGKSTLVKTVVVKTMSFGWEVIRCREHRIGWIDDVTGKIVLGHYPGIVGPPGIGEKPFQGTDMLSMSVQPSVIAFLASIKDDPRLDGYRVLYEGDRLFNSSFIGALRNFNILHRGFILTAPQNVLESRRSGRGDGMKEAFVKGRKTKYKRLLNEGTAEEVTLAEVPELEKRIINWFDGKGWA